MLRGHQHVDQKGVRDQDNIEVDPQKVKSKAKGSPLLTQLVTEIKIHKSLEHRNVILFDHVFEDSENVYIILELCHNHTLNEMMKKRKRTSELEVQYYLQQLIEGLHYLHHAKVIHREYCLLYQV